MRDHHFGRFIALEKQLNQRVTYYPSDSPLRQGSYRGLAATANNFAREMHVHELSRLFAMDALAFRLKNIEDARLRAALEVARVDNRDQNGGRAAVDHFGGQWRRHVDARARML